MDNFDKKNKMEDLEEFIDLFLFYQEKIKDLISCKKNFRKLCDCNMPKYIDIQFSSEDDELKRICYECGGSVII